MTATWTLDHTGDDVAYDDVVLRLTTNGVQQAVTVGHVAPHSKATGTPA